MTRPVTYADVEAAATRSLGVGHESIAGKSRKAFIVSVRLAIVMVCCDIYKVPRKEVTHGMTGGFKSTTSTQHRLMHARKLIESGDMAKIGRMRVNIQELVSVISKEVDRVKQ